MNTYMNNIQKEITKFIYQFKEKPGREYVPEKLKFAHIVCIKWHFRYRSTKVFAKKMHLSEVKKKRNNTFYISPAMYTRFKSHCVSSFFVGKDSEFKDSFPGVENTLRKVYQYRSKILCIFRNFKEIRWFTSQIVFYIFYPTRTIMSSLTV